VNTIQYKDSQVIVDLYKLDLGKLLLCVEFVNTSGKMIERRFIPVYDKFL